MAVRTLLLTRLLVLNSTALSLAASEYIYIYSRAHHQHQHALVEYILHHKHVAAVSSEGCDQFHIQHKTRICSHLVPSQCTAKLCNHEELRLQSEEHYRFLPCAGRLSTCQAERCPCHMNFPHKLGAELSRCSVP